jgi:hypothetical protein
MSNRNRYNAHGGGSGVPPGQGRDGDNRGRQRLSFEDDDYDFADDLYYPRRATGGHDYEACRRAIFQVTGDGDPLVHPSERRGGTAGLGLSEGGMTNLAPPAAQTYRVGPHCQSQEVWHGATGPPQAMLPGPSQAPVLAGPLQALGLGAVALPAAANQPPQQGGGLPYRARRRAQAPRTTLE